MRRFASFVLLLVLAGCSEDPGSTAGPGSTGGGGGAGGKDASGIGGAGAWPSGGTGGGSAGDASSSGCTGVTCSGHGSCTLADGGASCACDKGHHAVGLECQQDQSCSGVDCGTCGQCKVVGGIAGCECPSGYTALGNKCVLASNPCDTTSCAADEACVPEAHCQPLGACVKKCECGNCGNCGPDNSDGKWNDMQEYCGNPNASPATKACTTPCPPGEGCIPYSPAICWPMEGCFSL